MNKFITFLNQFKQHNPLLVEAIESGYNVLHEVTDLTPESILVNESVIGGSIDGIIHYDSERIGNWFTKRNLSNFKMHINIPIAFINNVNVDYDMRGNGIGSELFDMFIDICNEHNCEIIILESDSDEEQINGFDLDNWYLSMGFKVLTQSYENNIMIKVI